MASAWAAPPAAMFGVKHMSSPGEGEGDGDMETAVMPPGPCPTAFCAVPFWVGASIPLHPVSSPERTKVPKIVIRMTRSDSNDQASRDAPRYAGMRCWLGSNDPVSRLQARVFSSLTTESHRIRGRSACARDQDRPRLTPADTAARHSSRGSSVRRALASSTGRSPSLGHRTWGVAHPRAAAAAPRPRSSCRATAGGEATDEDDQSERDVFFKLRRKSKRGPTSGVRVF
jgi:hypothetical protein